MTDISYFHGVHEPVTPSPAIDLIKEALDYFESMALDYAAPAAMDQLREAIRALEGK
jgi:hypothetical protein